MAITMRDAIIQRDRGAAKKEDVRVYSLAVIVSIGGSVEVSNRPGYVWVRELGNNGSTFHCYNNAVAPLEGLPVIIGWSTKASFGREIIGKAPSIARNPDYDGAAYPRPHSEAHQMPKGNYGSDPLVVYQPAIAPLRVYPAYNFVVNVDPLDNYYVDGYPRTYSGGMVDVSSKKPAVGFKRWVLVYLNKTTNMLGTLVGAEVQASAVAPKPPVVQGIIPAGYVLVKGAATAIEVADIDDGRGLVHEIVDAKHNPYATADPTPNDDSSLGYGVGSTWVYNGIVYQCINPTYQAAVWRVISRPADAYATYRATPGLRGLWICGAVGDSGNIPDESGQGRTLTRTGSPQYHRLINSAGLETYITYLELVSSTSDYGTRATESGLSPTGTEAYIGTTKGMSAGIWYSPTDIGVAHNLLGKYGAAGQRSWYIQRTTSNTLQFGMSGNGTLTTTVTSANTTAAGSWYYVGATYIPSTSLTVYINNYGAIGRPLVATINTTSIPASMFSSTAAFTLGTLATLAGFTNGKVAYAYFAISALPAAWHTHLYTNSRWQFGV